jgi:hypothetical protein
MRTGHKSRAMIQHYTKEAEGLESSLEQRRFVFLNFAIPELRPAADKAESTLAWMEEISERIEDRPTKLLLLGSTEPAFAVDHGSTIGQGGSLVDVLGD